MLYVLTEPFFSAYKVLDADFVERKECKRDSDCSGLNARFLSKCGRYDCGLNANGPFACDAKSGLCISKRQHYNCKEDGACVNLRRLFLCEEGLCQNITSVYDCAFTATEAPLDCTDKRNCIALDGLYDCQRGMCSKVRKNGPR